MFFDIFFYIWIFIESFIFTSNLYEESQNDLAPFTLDFHGFIENDSKFQKKSRTILWKRIYPKKTEYLDFIPPFYSTFFSALALHSIRLFFLVSSCIQLFLLNLFPIFSLFLLYNLSSQTYIFSCLFKLYSICGETSER